MSGSCTTLAVLDDVADFRRRRLQERGLSGDGHLLGESFEPQRELHADVLPERENDAPALLGEAAEHRGDFPRAKPELRQEVASLGISDSLDHRSG